MELLLVIGFVCFGLGYLASHIPKRERGSYVATFRPCGHRSTYAKVGKAKAKRLAKADLREGGFEAFSLRRM